MRVTFRRLRGCGPYMYAVSRDGVRVGSIQQHRYGGYYWYARNLDDVLGSTAGRRAATLGEAKAEAREWVRSGGARKADDLGDDWRPAKAEDL
jgi:hypothetical protein